MGNAGQNRVTTVQPREDMVKNIKMYVTGLDYSFINFDITLKRDVA